MARNALVFALLLIAFEIVHSYSGLSDAEAWMKWKASHGRRYSTKQEELDRWKTWAKNKRLIDDHNRAYDEGRRLFKMALNDFADQEGGSGNLRSGVELKMTGGKRTPPAASFSSLGIPSSWDWREKGKVNAVENQGMMGSALSIDVADAVASYSAIFDQPDLYHLAVQEVIDCCLPDPIIDEHVFDCVSAHGGLCMNGSYHTGSAPNVCNNRSCKAVATCNVGKAVTNGNESALAEVVYSTPVVVSVDASHASFQLYSSGVYSDPSCSSTMLDHSLLLVGYGTSNGVDYWICRNTWGASWGEEGYIRIARNHNNMCGIASYAIYPSKN